MKHALIVALLGGAMLAAGLGCDEKKTDSLSDQMKKASDTAANKVKDAGNAVADKTKEMADKATAGVKDLMDNIQKKMDALAKGGESLKADQKGEFDKAMTGIHATWDDMSKSFNSLKDKSADAISTGMADLKTKGEDLLSKVKTTAQKFNINLG
jgi:hypothetical protein